MDALLIGYARVSTDAQDLTAQRDALQALGFDPERIYVDHGLTGTHRDRPGLRQALAACRAGDTLVVTKLDRLARSLPDARAIADELAAREVKLALGTSVHDPTDPVGRLRFNVLAMVAEFEADLIRAHARGHGGGKGQGPAARQAAQAEPDAGGASGQALPRRGAHRQRARGALRRHPLDGVPRRAARREERHRTRGRFRERHDTASKFSARASSGRHPGGAPAGDQLHAALRAALRWSPARSLMHAEPRRSSVWVLADPHVGRPIDGPSSPSGSLTRPP